MNISNEQLQAIIQCNQTIVPARPYLTQSSMKRSDLVAICAELLAARRLLKLKEAGTSGMSFDQMQAMLEAQVAYDALTQPQEKQ